METPVLSLFLLMPLFCVLFTADHVIVLVSGLCQSDQQSLLIQFHKSLAFNQSMSTRLVSWNFSSDCCDWAGVTCDEDGLGRVISLNLSSQTISGGIDNNSSALFRLQYLQNLDLSYNNISTSMPSRFADLTSLISLNLSSAGFEGQIPVEISYLTKLIELDLSVSGLFYSRPRLLKLENPNLATLVQNLTPLRVLRLDGVKISSSGEEWCRALSSFLPNLQTLSMSSCFLSGPFDSSLATLKYLSVIHLDGNNFSTQVPDFFANFSYLRNLHLSSCELQGIFPTQVFQISTLEIIDLSYNPDLQGHLPVRFHNGSLTTLELRNTNFSGVLPDTIGRLTNLTRINVAACSFTGQIPRSMENLTKLVDLDFSLNMFTGPVPSFSNSKKLTYMDFSYNYLSGSISNFNWKSLSDLVYIDLKNNWLTGSIPPSLFAIASLQNIQLSSNQFSGQVCDFSNASSLSLSSLDLSYNSLEGPIPHSVFDLRKLRILSLSGNKFNGTIKLDQIQKLVNLTALDLSYNQLTVDAIAANSTWLLPPWLTTFKLASCNLRVFPDIIRNQTNLFVLDLSDNQISGSVPQWIGKLGNGFLFNLNLSRNLLVSLPDSLSNLTSLCVLDLHGNLLQGNIPTPPPYASFLDYSDNNFSSSIPHNIGPNLSITIFFSLSNNNVEGGIPESLCNATYLRVLDLSNNKLNGPIPSCLIELSRSLGVLNLRKNNCNGSIPDNFPEKCVLQTLDLSRNSLEGKVPRSLINCSALEVLDLGSNTINDTFPCLLRNISNLRVLNLRNNKFHGDVMSCPSINPSVNPTWTRLQIFDIALNHFSGRLPNSKLRSWKAMMGDGNEAHDHIRFGFLVLSGLYYQDSTTVTSKGLEMQLVKILTVFTSIDVSCNKFEGPIPDGLGQLKALYVLNLSHNALTGQIPSSLANVSNLESLDLSNNQLTGKIPQELVQLTFLSNLNLSYNHLVGSIPSANQFTTFENTSYSGNLRLCGPPLSRSCGDSSAVLPTTKSGNVYKRRIINWKYLSVEFGYIFGLIVTVGPLVLWERWRIQYYKHIDPALIKIFPRLEDRIINISSRRRRRRW